MSSRVASASVGEAKKSSRSAVEATKADARQPRRAASVGTEAMREDRADQADRRRGRRDISTAGRARAAERQGAWLRGGGVSGDRAQMGEEVHALEHVPAFGGEAHDYFRELSQSAGVLRWTGMEIEVHLVPTVNYPPKLRKIIDRVLHDLNQSDLTLPDGSGRKLRLRLTRKEQIEVRVRDSDES